MGRASRAKQTKRQPPTKPELQSRARGEVPLKPEMIPVMQTLANEVVGWETNVKNAQTRWDQAKAAFQTYVDQCAELLKLDMNTVTFNTDKAAFLPLPGHKPDKPTEDVPVANDHSN